MTKRPNTRRYRKASDRRVWVFSDLNHDLTPELMAKLIAKAGLEKAHEDAAARRAQLETREAKSDE